MAQLLLLGRAGLPQEGLGKAAPALAALSPLNSESSNSVTELGEEINQNFSLSKIELFTLFLFFFSLFNSGMFNLNACFVLVLYFETVFLKRL